MNISVQQISAQLEAVLSHDSSALSVAIRAPGKQNWPEALMLQGRSFALRWCDSMLAIREALCDVERVDATREGMVVLTPFGSHEISADIAARLSRGRVFQAEAWEIVRHLFGAREVDARLAGFAWMPEYLIEGAAQGAYEPVTNDFLDLETGWKMILKRFLKLEMARPDAIDLLQWTRVPGVDGLLNALPTTARRNVLTWLSESAGMVGKMVLACVEAGRSADAISLGLVCDVLYAKAGEGSTALGQASIRLERFVNDQHVGVTEGRAWAQAAKQVVRELKDDESLLILGRAETLLNDLRVAEFAHLSDILPSGFEQRLLTFASHLMFHVNLLTEDTLAKVEAEANRIQAHSQAETLSQRADRVEMARRMARWLRHPVASLTTVSDFLCWQADEGAFVDWARFRLLGGDELEPVSLAYQSLRTAIKARRTLIGKPFAGVLHRWNSEHSATGERTVPVESILNQVVAPIAAVQPVLLLVVDGLSNSIFRELFSRPERWGWSERVPIGLDRPLAGIAAFPTVTEVSRASLLCGKLMVGSAPLEKTGFATHAGLLAQSRAGVPPKLFHKGDLSDASNLASEVRTAIANPQQRVVGLVYNAIDDHLSGPDQLHQRWNLEDLRLLQPILHEAKEARRAIVITADHGHLLEEGTTQLSGSESDRWRTGSTTQNSDEVVLTGGRVRSSTGANSVVCLWNENVRYAGRKNGYHGGVSLQEVTVPLNVLVPIGMTLTGWQCALPAQPEWWDLPNKEIPRVNRIPEVPARRIPASPAAQQSLFDASVDTTAATLPQQTDDWVSILLQSKVYVSQRSLAKRVAPPDDQMRKLLAALEERGGKLSKAALAQKLSLPEIRLNGMLSASRRILNIDQSDVLHIDEATGSVELNKNLLIQQFRITFNRAVR